MTGSTGGLDNFLAGADDRAFGDFTGCHHAHRLDALVDFRFLHFHEFIGLSAPGRVGGHRGCQFGHQKGNGRQDHQYTKHENELGNDVFIFLFHQNYSTSAQGSRGSPAL